MFVLKWNVAIQGELKSENNISGTTVLFRVNVSITRANELIQLMVKFTPHDTWAMSARWHPTFVLHLQATHRWDRSPGTSPYCPHCWPPSPSPSPPRAVMESKCFMSDKPQISKKVWNTSDIFPGRSDKPPLSASWQRRMNSVSLSQLIQLVYKKLKFCIYQFIHSSNYKHS